MLEKNNVKLDFDDFTKNKRLCLVYIYKEKFGFEDALKNTINQYKNMGVILKMFSINEISNINTILNVPAFFFYKNNNIIYKYYGNSLNFITSKIKQFLFNIDI